MSSGWVEQREGVEEIRARQLPGDPPPSPRLTVPEDAGSGRNRPWAA
ncbi:MAG: hypothetical protein ABSF27_06300 [Candidatus Dormibacteria bacterium]